MRHAKRDYLSQEDIRLALKSLNMVSSADRVFHYPSNWPVNFKKLPSGQQPNSAMDDRPARELAHLTK